MSNGGITQLVAIGAQDVHITGDPQVTFFHSTYKRHTNFSMFNAEQIIQGTPGPGRMSTFEIGRSGDLLSYTYLVSYDSTTGKPVADTEGWSNLIDYCELLIGGQVVDTQDTTFTENIAPDVLSQTFAKSSFGGNHGGGTNESLFYPFRFFFCESWQHVLPLIAMPYSTIEIRIYWKSSLASNYRFRAFSKYIALDTVERDNLVNSDELNILMFQVQKSPASRTKVQELNFNHPVKFLVSTNTQSETNMLCSKDALVRLEANGTELTDYLAGAPFFTSIPSYYHTEYAYGNDLTMFIVPFCLSTCKIQPTGSLNFSRLDSFKIHCSEPITEPVYAVNFNVLKIKNGMCAQMYAN